ncbi:MAG TPA: P-II family nitrogen regulator [Candidatus Eisenbacteria bacterium]|jgi:nitrogen regulatory protein P-II 1|nr:P-II family nitrogen regulator [Candidatus Eisenbacteria bacterium]
MKRIDAVIRREQFESVKRALDSAVCPGMMVFSFRGHGNQGGIVESHRGRKFKIDLLPKVLLTIFVNDGDVKKIVDAIAKAAKTGKIGDGKIFVSPLDNAIRIRTGEEGAKAI